MKLMIIITLVFLSSNLFSKIILKKHYYVKNDYILLTDIVPSAKKNPILYKFDFSKHTKRIKTSDIGKKLKQYGFIEYKSVSNYIEFNKKSPINTQKIKNIIQKKYHNIYHNIKIKSITVGARRYLNKIPKHYEVVLQKRYYLSRSGILYIKTVDKKKIFFNYNIELTLDIYRAKKDIKKGEELSQSNSKKNSILLDKFRAMPLQTIKKATLEAKHNIKVGTILTQKDAVGLSLVKRGDTINISLEQDGINMSIFAKALQSGKISQYIYVRTANGKKIKVLVTGRNRAKIDE